MHGLGHMVDHNVEGIMQTDGRIDFLHNASERVELHV